MFRDKANQVLLNGFVANNLSAQAIRPFLEDERWK